MLGAFLLAVAAAAGPARPSIVLVTLDTTRADHLGCYGAAGALTPSIDAVARDGVRFERALSPAPLTLPAHASVLSGLVPRRHGVRDNAGFRLAADVPLLTERLREAGYETAAFVSSAVLDRDGGLARGFATYDDGVRIGDRRAFNYEERAASQTMDAVLPRLGSLEEPFFLWVHFYDPHLPYVPPGPYAARFAGRTYDGEIAFMDAEVGRLMAALRNKGGAPIVVIAGDHGESLGEHGENGHGVFVYQATQHVPLILKGPRIAVGATVSSTVGLIDVAPTLLELAGLPPIARIDGRSLKPFLRGGNPPPRDYEMESYYPTFAYGWAALRALVSGPYKYVDAPRRELYELPTDPREVRDLAGARKARLLDMARALDVRAGSLASIDAGDDPAMEERRAALSSLGYAGGSRAPAAGGIDPKDGIKLLPDLDAARRALQTGRPGDALEPLQKILGKNSGNVPAMLALGQAQLGLGKPAEAVATYRKVTSASPNNSLAWLQLGNAHAATAATDRDAHAAARSAYERSLALSPRNAETYLNYAALLATRPDEALRILQRAKQLEVADPVIEAELGVIELARGQTATARAAFERSLSLNPRQVEALEGLGKIHYAAGEYREAADLYGRAVEVAPSAPLAKTLGAIRLYQLGDRAGARTAFERALALTLPGDPDAATLRSLIVELSK